MAYFAEARCYNILHLRKENNINSSSSSSLRTFEQKHNGKWTKFFLWHHVKVLWKSVLTQFWQEFKVSNQMCAKPVPVAASVTCISPLWRLWQLPWVLLYPSVNRSGEAFLAAKTGTSGLPLPANSASGNARHSGKCSLTCKNERLLYLNVTPDHSSFTDAN